MLEVTKALSTLGSESIKIGLLPLVIWTLIALLIKVVLWKLKAAPEFQFQSRATLLLILPLGLIGSAAMHWWTSISGSTPGGIAEFIVVQSPIAVTVTEAAGAAAASAWGDPVLWVGGIVAIITTGSIIALGCHLWNFYKLRKISKALSFSPLQQLLDQKGLSLPCEGQATVAFSKNVQVPFTYGHFRTHIVLPESLQSNNQDLFMTLKHELLHIEQRDFLINNILSFSRRLFWFHPLVHRLHRECTKYREMTCDNKVIADAAVSKKSYARLLYRMATKPHNTNRAIISMAVNPSTLKNRIKMMNTQTNTFTTTKKSLFLMSLAAFLVVGVMSCSDLQEDGLTNSDVKKVQSDIQNKPLSSEPLYIVNGERMADREITRKQLSLLKSKYIESVNVLKGEKAMDEYGEAGKNGVVSIKIHNEERALSDLRESSSLSRSSMQEEDFFVAVEEMPELKGGLAALQKNIQYPEEAREADEEGRVIVQFIVTEQGEVENPQIIKGVSESLNQETLRVVKQAEFTPGMQKGQPVRVQYSLPISFRLAADN